MKKLLLLLAFASAALYTNAQAPCTPDTMYDSVGVYPVPDSLGGGLVRGCEDSTYFEKLTVVVPDTVLFMGFKVAMERVKVLSITGLPSGMTYDCNPDTCGYVHGTKGCATLEGPVGMTPGAYDFKVNVRVFFKGGFLPPLDTNYSGYRLTILAAPCISSIDDTKVAFFDNGDVKVYPNPFSDQTTIQYLAEDNGSVMFSVFNTLGEMVETRSIEVEPGFNPVEFQRGDLPDGLYIFRFTQNQRVHSGRMVIRE